MSALGRYALRHVLRQIKGGRAQVRSYKGDQATVVSLAARVRLGSTDRSVAMPSTMCTLRCARAASSGSWVTMMIVAPCELMSSSRSEEHTSELQSLMRISYAVFCLKKNNKSIS